MRSSLLTAVTCGILAIAPSASAQNFTDIAGYWAEQYVSALAQRQIIGGFPDNTFKPNHPITRAQFAAIAVRAFNLPMGGSGAFVDVPNNYWAAAAIRAVSNASLVTGFPDGTFRPEERITRAQALVVLTKALGNRTTPNPAALERYVDRQAVPEWALDSMARAANAGIIVNFPNANLIDPNRVATRGEVTALIYQTLFRLGTQGLPPLTIGTLPAGGEPTPAPQPTLTIDAIQLNIDPRQTLSAGDELVVTASGTPQASANFVLVNANQNQPIAMSEIRAGVYQGRYTVKRSDGQVNARLVVNLQRQGATPASREFNSVIAINTGAVLSPQPQFSLKPEILNLQNNQTVNFPVEIQGRTVPNANIQIIGEAVNSVGGLVNVMERLYTLNTKANAQGTFTVQLPQVRSLVGTPVYRIRFTASDPQSQQTATTEITLRQQ